MRASVVNTGDASSTSPWWRSFVTSARRIESGSTGSGSGVDIAGTIAKNGVHRRASASIQRGLTRVNRRASCHIAPTRFRSNGRLRRCCSGRRATPSRFRPMPIDAVNAAVKAQILAEALPYIQRFHDKEIVIKYGGNAMTEPALKAGFARDVVMLKLVGMNPVIVHGGGPQIGDLLTKMGIKSEFRQGMRVTDERVMNVVEMVLGELNQEIVGLINQHGGKAVGLTGQDGTFIHARKMLLRSDRNRDEMVDIGLVGEIDRIDPEIIQLLDSRDFIPVVAPIGVGADGVAYNINADLVAGKLAETLLAEKLVLMTNTVGVLDRN